MGKKRASLLWIFPIVGLVAGFLVNYLYSSGLTVIWRSIGSPGEKISRVEGVNNGYLYVRGEGGSQYTYLMDEDYASEEKYEWTMVTPRRVEDQSRQADARWKNFPLLVKAQPLWERQFVYNIEGTAYVKLAVEDDGTVWLWKMTRPWGELMMLVCFPALGLLTGLLVWAVIRASKKLGERRIIESKPG